MPVEDSELVLLLVLVVVELLPELDPSTRATHCSALVAVLAGSRGSVQVRTANAKLREDAVYAAGNEAAIPLTHAPH